MLARRLVPDRRLALTLALALVLAFALLPAPPLAAGATHGADGAAGAAADPRAARLDSLLSRYHEVGLFNGSALVARDGEVLLEGGYGLADFEFAVPNGAETRHWLASVSKVFTATMVLRLADAGKLSLDDRVADLLPWYRPDTGARMTVRHLLSHTSGLPDYMHLPGVGRDGFRQQAGDGVIDVLEFAKAWCSNDLQWEPGERWGYSNSGYVLLGAIIERVAGQPFEQALRELILEPAGLTGAGDLAMRPRAVVPGLTPGYEQQGRTVSGRRHWNVSTAYAAGAMYATVGDLFRFDRALYRDDFVSPAAKEAMFTAGPGDWGCGWEVRRLPIGPGGAERTVVGHEGFIFWSLARIWRIEQDGIFVALVNNTGDAPLKDVFAGITDILYGREPRWPLPSAAWEVYSVAAADGGEAAAARYRGLLASAPQGYDFSEGGLNQVGYALLQEGKAAAAVAIFELMVERFPQSGNAWDSLGEGLAGAGRREEAIRAYTRSLELLPENAGARAWLEKLRAAE